MFARVRPRAAIERVLDRADAASALTANETPARRLW